MSDRFPRPVVCDWCGNRHSTAIPDNLGRHGRYLQGHNCAASVSQVTAELVTRIESRDPATAWMWERESRAIRDLPIGTWFVMGHYGSTGYDQDVLKFVRDAPTAPAGTICDDCIGERLAAGDLERCE